VSLCCAIGYEWVTKSDCVNFEFNDIISLYKKNEWVTKMDCVNFEFNDIISLYL